MTARINVLATSALTYITILSAFLVSVSGELPQEWQAWTARAVVALGSAATMIRRVTPVAKPDRGLVAPSNDRSSRRRSDSNDRSDEEQPLSWHPET